MNNKRKIEENKKLVNKVVSKMFYFIPELISLDDEDKYDEIITYILTELGKVEVERFTNVDYAYFADKVAKKFNLKTASTEEYIKTESKVGEKEELEEDNLEYLLLAYETIGELVPGLGAANLDDFNRAYEIMYNMINLEDPKSITNVELAQVAYAISEELGLEAHPDLLGYLEKVPAYN